MSETAALWVIVGATGTGKTQLSLELAHHLKCSGRNVEIVNADAMQFYRGMNIGTAKLSEAERATVPHHLFDVLDPVQEATVAWYQPLARRVIADALSRDTEVILVGGSGLYVSSVIFDFQFPPRDAALRANLEAQFQRDGAEPLVRALTHEAPEIAATIDLRNTRRVIRALELHRLGANAHGRLPSTPKLWNPRTHLFGVRCERATLVQRLDARVAQMWADGLLNEVQHLLTQRITEGPTASRAIGYAQAIEQLTGTLSETDAIAQTQTLTRRYARRQVSWFQRYPGLTWLDGPDLQALRESAEALH